MRGESRIRLLLLALSISIGVKLVKVGSGFFDVTAVSRKKYHCVKTEKLRSLETSTVTPSSQTSIP